MYGIQPRVFGFEGQLTPFQTIWQIDANETDVFQSRLQLEKHGMCRQFQAFNSGRAGIFHLSQAETLPDVILLELYLPGKGGLDLVGRNASAIIADNHLADAAGPYIDGNRGGLGVDGVFD